MRFSIPLLVILLLIPFFGWADEGPNGDWELTVHSGWSFLDIERRVPICIVCLVPFPVEDFFPSIIGFKVKTEDSVTLGFRVGYYLNDHAEVEGGFLVAPNHDLVVNNFFDCPPGRICPLFPFFEIQQNMVSYHYNGSFVYNILTENVRPFVSFGIGGVSNDIDPEVQTDFSLNLGAGAKFYFKNLGLRFEVNDHVIPDHFLSKKTEHNLQISYGFLFRLK